MDPSKNDTRPTGCSIGEVPGWRTGPLGVALNSLRTPASNVVDSAKDFFRKRSLSCGLDQRENDTGVEKSDTAPDFMATRIET